MNPNNMNYKEYYETLKSSSKDNTIVVSSLDMNSQLSKNFKSWCDASACLLSCYISDSAWHGKMIILVPLYMLWAHEYEDLRKNVLSNSQLAYVAILTPLQQYDNENLCVVLLHRDKHLGKVQMADASMLDVPESNTFINELSLKKWFDSLWNKNKTIVGHREILRNAHVSWDPKEYIQLNSQIHPLGYKVVPVYSLLKPMHKIFSSETKTGTVVRRTSLWDNGYDYKLSALELCGSGYNQTDVYKLTEPVLLASFDKPLKIGYCEASESSPVFASSDIYAYKVLHSSIDIGYLCVELVKNNINRRLPYITEQEFLDIKVALPPVDGENSITEQKNIFNAGKSEYVLSKIKEFDYISKIDDQRYKYIAQLKTWKHDMMPYLNQITAAGELLHIYLNKLDDIQMKQDMQIVLDKEKKAVKMLSSLIEQLSSRISFDKAELLNLDEYFYNLEVYHDDNSGYDIIYDYDMITLNKMNMLQQNFGNHYLVTSDFSNAVGVSLKDNHRELFYTRIAETDFDRIVRNILDNAERHAFFKKEPDKNYQVHIYLTVDVERNMYRIDFSNNGIPFPFGLDKTIYGMRGKTAGPTGHTGEGGYIIKEIVSHYGGDYDIIRRDYDSVVRIYLPIVSKYER